MKFLNGKWRLTEDDVDEILGGGGGKKELTHEQLADGMNRLLEKGLRKTPNENQARRINGAGFFGAGGGDWLESEVEEDGSGFKGFADFIRTVANSPGDGRLQKDMSVQDPEAGGYLVPVEYHDVLLNQAIEKSVLLGKVQKVGMKTTEEKFARIIDTDHSGGSTFGGVKFEWTAEKAGKQQSEPKIGTITLRAKVAASLCRVTNQLLEDSKPSVEKALRSLFADALAWTLDGVIVSGTGAGQPQGIMNSGALVECPAEGGQPAGTIVFENAMAMYSRLNPAWRPGAVWLISPTAIPQIMAMSLTVGAGGAPVMIASGAGISPIPEKIFGVPIIWTEHCSALGEKGDILLVQPRAYLLGVRREMAVAASIHVHFSTNETLLRFEWRGDGQPMMNEKLTIKSGGGFQVSPFVTLEART